MVNGGQSKNQSQRKRRQEQESCINNIQLNNPSKEYSRRKIRPIDNSTYTRKPIQQVQRSSLENVASNTWRELQSGEQTSLRRSRSLAITREDIFTNLDIQTDSTNINKPRRSQLIPRAKLIEKNLRSGPRGSSVENLNSIDRTIKKDLNISPPDYSPLLDNSIRRDRQNRRTSIEPENVYSSVNSLSGILPIGLEQNNLYSNYYNQSLINNGFNKASYDDLPELSLPNYYPDSKYDTDNTDAISLAENLSIESCNNSKKYSSCDNISAGKWTLNEPESIPYDDNIILSANRPLYDSIRENHYAKPRTIRGPTPYSIEKEIYNNTESKHTQSPINSLEDKNKDKEKASLDYFESNSNLDEINLNNENITKTVPENDIETEVTEEITEEKIEEIEEKPTESNENKEAQEDYKTIVTVDPDIVEDTDEENKHSHNYLREFLESQKGSKKPLQNFISKKLLNLSRKSSKDINSNLSDNRFYSLPDITAGKYLRKCENIDRKLRKCDKTAINKTTSETNESRFIVNIGKHFDITANANVPVDFELKIAKIPRRNKSKRNKNKPEEQFLQAIQNLKETLNNNNQFEDNQNLNKPEIVAVKAKICEEDKNEQDETMNNECTKEYHEKLGTMRNYWDKMINGNDKKEEPPKSPILDTQMKIEDAKKKFEPNEETEPEKPNKVQITKQLFEKKSMKKVDKLSPFIKETCNYFENSKKENQYESLNPNTVEIITKNENRDKSKHKPVNKSKNIVSPEFDHVRYRVVKSDLFQKKIFANCEKESQFDGLMQYLQDYSFQELLRDNNIVIIEPIRTKIPYETSKTTVKTAKNITPLLHKQNNTNDTNESNGLKRHFFYHPIRVNKEVNDDELPNPDTVKQVRQFFEGELKRSQSSQEFESVTKVKSIQKNVDPDKDHCSATDSNSNPSNMSDFGSNENLYDSLTEHCCEQQYVSEDILEKIRECGTTVTYYGGRVVNKRLGQASLTKVIMEEIKNNEKRSIECKCKKIKDDKKENKDIYQGVKFRLIKSNSCNSRLELVGTNDLKKSKQKYFINKQKQQNLKQVKEIENKQAEKNNINETIRTNMEDTQPKIIGEERKMTQWGETTKEKTFNGINYSNKSRGKITYDYHNYDNLKEKAKKIDDMEFEPYEVA